MPDRCSADSITSTSWSRHALDQLIAEYNGRIVIAAAARYGARGVGIDTDRQRIAEANELAAQQGVSDLVSFRVADLFEADFREATVVTLYLLASFNMELRERLVGQLGAGTRIVSHAFDMGDWRPDKKIDVDGRHLCLWTVPGQDAGGRVIRLAHLWSALRQDKPWERGK